MPRRRLILPCLLTLLAVWPRPSHALRPDILYLGDGKFVQISPTRQLTLNAHVTQFAYDPLGQRAAVVGRETDGDRATLYVKTIDVHSGREMNRLTMTAPVGDETARYNLIGWSGSGRYLLVERWLPLKQLTEQAAQGKPAGADYLRWDLGGNPPVVAQIALMPLPPGAWAASTFVRASPTGRLVFFRQEYKQTSPVSQQEETQKLYTLFDPETSHLLPIRLPYGFGSYGHWLDDGHLLIRGDTSRVSESLDVTTNVVVPYAATTKTKPTSRAYPLALDAEARTLDDTQTTGAQAASHVVWLRRIAPSKDPLGAAAAAVTSGEDDPLAVWSPTGRQIAYVSHGDLCVTDLTAPDEIPEERQALGLPLSCTEERALARVNVKNVDMAMFWYSMAHGDRFPTAGEFQSSILSNPKYANDLHTESVRFVYHEPPDRLRSHLEKQRELVIGEFDLPCARVVLMGDGTVQTLPKQETGP